jgi:hypothetical protein
VFSSEIFLLPDLRSKGAYSEHHGSALASSASGVVGGAVTFGHELDLGIPAHELCADVSAHQCRI